MPQQCLHMTTLEITFSRTAEEIAVLVRDVASSVADITDYTFLHRARLVKPLVSYDGAAVALSFVPAAREGKDPELGDDDAYTYHHLRRDIYNLCERAGVTISSRYSVPSAHLTIARFVTAEDHSRTDEKLGSVSDEQKMKTWVAGIDRVNDDLRSFYWPSSDAGLIQEGGQWLVGEEKGLDCRFGTLWYGGGSTLRLGRGF